MTRIFDHPDFDQHEQVIFCMNDKVGLRAIIALHSTVLGPAAGGCRMYPYESEADALADALRLSKGMTYKNAVAILPTQKNPNFCARLPSMCNH